MPTPDDPRSRRSLAVLSHGKPKPYRRMVYSDEPYRVSRGQAILLMLGAALVAALILAVAVVAQEHANATRGKQIIAADEDADPIEHVPGIPAAPPALTGLAAVPPALDDSALPIPVPRHPPAPVLVVPPPLARPAIPRAPRRVAMAPAAVPAPAADPDVDLIATILALTPPASPAQAAAVCTAGPECGKAPPMRP